MSVQSSERELRDSARLMVRAGLVHEGEQEAALTAMVTALMPDTDPAILAKAWLHSARLAWRRAAADWPAPTDHDSFRSAMTECQRHGILVAAGVESLDELRARSEARVAATGRDLRGLLWFSERAVWHAIDGGVLEVGLRHGTGAPVVASDELVSLIVECIERHGLRARGVPGGLQVECAWRRRP